MTTQNTKGTALVTGASSGIGAVYAERLARRGYDLLLVARDQQRLDKLAASLRADFGVAVEVLVADLTQKAEIKTVAQRLRSDTAISLLVNNAGVAMDGPLIEANGDAIDRMLELNITAVTHLAAAAGANFAAAGRGAIINLASVVALAPEMFNATYSATKAYVLSLSQSLHSELAKQGVQLQAVLPGVTRTEIWERAGIDSHQIPAAMVMDAGEMVDAALAGFDQGELVTIPSLPDAGDWNAFVAARQKLAPNLSHSKAAARYKA